MTHDPYNGFHPGDEDPLYRRVVKITLATFAIALVALVLAGCSSVPASAPAEQASCALGSPNVTEALARIKGGGSDFDTVEHLTGDKARQFTQGVFGTAPAVVSDVLLLKSAAHPSLVRVVVFFDGCFALYHDLGEPEEEPEDDPAA